MPRILSAAVLLEVLEGQRVIHRNGHYVGISGKHLPDYIDKGPITATPAILSLFCREIAAHFGSSQVETVIGPGSLGAMFASWTAYHLLTPTTHNCFADKTVRGRFKLRQSFIGLIQGRRVLIVDDNLTTGFTVKLIIELVKKYGGIVVGVGIMCKRGEVTAESLDVPDLFYATSVPAVDWPEAECPLCKDDVPVNTDLGQGKKFLARKRREARRQLLCQS